jgi:ribosomal protein S17E
MGKVRTEMVKRISNELVDKYDRVSKKLRNKIAGYVTGLMKIEETAQF